MGVYEKRKELTQTVAVGFPKVLSQTPPLTPVPEGSVIGAVFRQNNNIASVLNRSANGLDVGEPIPNFDPLPYVPQQYFNYADRYIGLTNIDQVYRMTEILRQEFNDKAIMQAYPYRSLAYGAVAGVLDFPGLLMPGGVLYSEYKLGASIAKSALSVGIASLVGASIDETILYNSQYTRSVQESVNNIAIRTILGSVLGAAGGWYASRNAPKVVNAAMKEASDIYENGNPTYVIEFKDGGFTVSKPLPAPKPKNTPSRGKEIIQQGESWRASGDANPNVPTRLNQVTPSGEYPDVNFNSQYEDTLSAKDSDLNPVFTDTVFDESAKISGLPRILDYGLKHNPYMRLKTSEFNSANFVSDLLFDTRTGTIATDEKGISKPTNLQGLMYSNFWKFNSAFIEIQDIFYQQKGDIWKTIKDADQPKGLSAEQFAVDLAYYIRNPGVVSPNKDIAKAVDIAVNKILKPMRDWAVSVGKLEEWQEIEGYLMRVWNREYVVENQPQLAKLLYGYYKEVDNVLRATLPKIDALNTSIKRANDLLQQNANVRTEVAGYETTVQQNNIQAQQAQRDLELATTRVRQSQEVLANKTEHLRVELLSFENDIAQIQAERDLFIKDNKEKLQGEIDFLKGKKIKALRGAAQQDKSAAFVQKLSNRYDKELAALEKELARLILNANSTATKDIAAIKKQMQKLSKEVEKDIKDLKENIKSNKDKAATAEKLAARLAKDTLKLQTKIIQLQDLLKKQPDDVLNKSLEMFNKALEALKVQDIYGTKGNHLIHDDGSYRVPRDDKELLADANETVLTILSFGDDALDSMILSKVLPQSAKPLKHRKILISDRLLGNFIKQDAFEILSRYIKVMNPVLTSTEYAQNFGVNNLEEVAGIFKKTVRDEYTAKSFNAPPATARKLEKHLNSILKDIDDSIEIIMNVYGGGRNNDAWYVEYLQKFRTFNTFRLMGSMTLSSLSDIGTMALTHGPFQIIYEGILPLLKSKELRAMMKSELQALGWALNHQTGQLIKSAADTGSLVVQPNKFSGIIDRLLQGFGNVTLINQWSNVLEMIGGTVSTNKILGSIETVVKGGTLSERDTKWLNRLGIGQQHYQTIYDLWQKYGGTLENVNYSNHHKWRLTTPEEAAAFNAFRLAITRDMRHMLVRPGPETKPKAMYSELGKTLFQFKSYFFAATDKVLMSSMQDRGDMETWIGIMILLSIGALQYVITSLTHDREPDLSLQNLAKESIDRTGILGIYAEYFNIFAKLNLIPGLGTTRYQTRGIMGAFGGPTIGALEDFATFMGKINQAVTDGRELTSKDYAVMLRLMPYQNLFYTRRLSRYLLGIEEFKGAGAPIETGGLARRRPAEINPEGRKR